MDAVVSFIESNLWLCLLAAAVFVALADEALGISSALLGDDSPAQRDRPASADEVEDASGAVEDLFPRR